MSRLPPLTNSIHRHRFLINLILLTPVVLLLGASAPQVEDRAQEAEAQARIEKAIEDVKSIHLRIDEATPHDIARGIFAFGKKFKVYEKDGTYIFAVEYLLQEAKHGGKRIFVEKDGEVWVLSPGRERGQVQDLPDEILMSLGLAGVSLDEKIIISEKKEVTVKDLLETAKKRVNPSVELSASMVAFASYVPWEEEWMIGRRGKTRMSIGRLLNASLQKNPAAYLDKGAHHLFGIAYLLRKGREADGLPSLLEKALTDRLAQRRVRMKSQQAADGGLGFLGVNALERTAENLHWVLSSGPWEEIHQPWMDRAAQRLSKEVQKAVKRQRARYGTLALAARTLSEYSRLKYPEPG